MARAVSRTVRQPLIGRVTTASLRPDGSSEVP
jgi:hypothetical protein